MACAGEAVVKAQQAADGPATAAGVRLGRILSIRALHYDCREPWSIAASSDRI